MMAEDELCKIVAVDECGHWRDPMMNREDVWRQALAEEGHVAFVLDDIEYFIVPLGPHAYGLNTWAEYKANGGYAKWKFSSEDELLKARLFKGKSILERLDEILLHEAE